MSLEKKKMLVVLISSQLVFGEQKSEMKNMDICLMTKSLLGHVLTKWFNYKMMRRQ